MSARRLRACRRSFARLGAALVLACGLGSAVPFAASVAAPSGAQPPSTGYDGGVFAFSAPIFGSMGGKHLNSPVVGLAQTTDRGIHDAPLTTTTTRSPSAKAHVMLVMMENRDYSSLIGSSTWPYANHLASSYGLATDSYAHAHPSLPNYLEIYSGSDQGVRDDNPPSSHTFHGERTLGDELAKAGISEKAYAEDLPADPSNESGEYAVRHFPIPYFPGDSMPIANASTLQGDLNSASPPDFVWYTPNLIDDGHDGSDAQADSFLHSFIPMVQATNWYKSGGQIIIEWDESVSGNIGGGNPNDSGGHIPTIVVSAALHRAKATGFVDTAGVLRSIEDAYKVTPIADSGTAASGNLDSLVK